MPNLWRKKTLRKNVTHWESPQTGWEFFDKLVHYDITCFSETWREHGEKDSSLLNVNENYTEFHESCLKNHLEVGGPRVCLF